SPQVSSRNVVHPRTETQGEFGETHSQRRALARARDSGRGRYVGEGSGATWLQVASQVRVSWFVTKVGLNADRTSSGGQRCQAFLPPRKKISGARSRNRRPSFA